MAKVLDPVCGIAIDTDKAAARSHFEGHSYYFCSEACAQEFVAHPQQVLEKHEPPRTTSGFFTAPKFGAAGSGGAEYELLPEAHK